MDNHRFDRIECDGVNTPEHIALRRVSEKLNRDIEAEKEGVIRALHTAGVIPHRVVRDDVAGVVLSEVARDPVLFYAFQYVLDQKNVGNRYSDILMKLDERFCGKYELIMCSVSTMCPYLIIDEIQKHKTGDVDCRRGKFCH